MGDGKKEWFIFHRVAARERVALEGSQAPPDPQMLHRNNLHGALDMKRRSHMVTDDVAQRPMCGRLSGRHRGGLTKGPHDTAASTLRLASGCLSRAAAGASGTLDAIKRRIHSKGSSDCEA